MADYTSDPAVSVCFIVRVDRKSTRLNSSHSQISYAVFCLKKKKIDNLASVFRSDNLITLVLHCRCTYNNVKKRRSDRPLVPIRHPLNTADRQETITDLAA